MKPKVRSYLIGSVESNAYFSGSVRLLSLGENFSEGALSDGQNQDATVILATVTYDMPIISDDPLVMSLQRERPAKGKFSKEETTFLKKHLPDYEALCHELTKQATGPRGTGSVKGFKKEWILSEVYSEFVKQFSSDQDDGPQLQSLQSVSY